MTIPGALRVITALTGALLVATAQAQNLVPNGGFEGGASGWGGGIVVADTPHTGAACLHVDDADPSSSVAAATVDIVAVEQGLAYLFEVWVRAPGEGQQTLVTLNQYDAGDQWISGNNMDFVIAAGPAWRRFHMVIRSFHPDAAGVKVSLRPVRWSAAGELEGEAWFDDVVLEEHALDEQLHGAWVARGGAVELWRAPAEQAVIRALPLDVAAPSEVELSMAVAGGEREPLQLVLHPTIDDQLTEVTLSTLEGPGGSSVAATAFSRREVAFVEVTEPTDHGSTVGWRPDPLPLLALPLALGAGVQQPLWITLTMPAGTPAGEYLGAVLLSFSSSPPIAVPLRVRVWGFDLPVEHHMRTAYGLSLGAIDRYHNLGGDAARRRQVLRLYLEDFAAHRISPYDPFGDDGFAVRYPNWNWGSGAVVDDPAPVGASSQVLEVDDDRAEASVYVAAEVMVPIEAGQDYRLSWRARTDGAHDYLVTLNQHDASGAWISGGNLDHTRDGDGSWQQEQALLSADRFNAQTASVRVRLYARRWTAGGELLGRTWFDDVALGVDGSGVNLVPNGDFDLPPDQIEVEVDFDAFDVAASLAFDQLGFDSFRLRLPGFASGSYQGGYVGQLLSFAWGTPEYQALFTSTLRAITEHLAARGWLELAYAYWFDEPHAADYAMVVEGMSLLQAAEPRLARLLTEQLEPELTGMVDVWVPILDQYDPTWAHARQALGEEVWWYVCTGPRAPFPNDFIDHPLIEPRLRFWLAWRHQVQGSLYWHTNYWTQDDVFPPPDHQDPWLDPMSYNFNTGAVGTWGNGDGRLLYPPRGWQDGVERIEGPTPSIRWELLREGIEDYEYLWLLQDVATRLEARGTNPSLVDDARDLLEVPQEIATSLTEFTDDPSLIAARRIEVAAAIEQVLAALGGAAQLDGGLADAALTDGAAEVDAALVDAALADAMVADTPASRDGASSAPDQPAGVDASEGCACAGQAPGASATAWIGLSLALLGWRRR